MCIVQCVDIFYRSGTFHFVHVASRQILFSQVRNKQAFLIGFPFIDCVQKFFRPCEHSWSWIITAYGVSNSITPPSGRISIFSLAIMSCPLLNRVHILQILKSLPLFVSLLICPLLQDNKFGGRNY